MTERIVDETGIKIFVLEEKVKNLEEALKRVEHSMEECIKEIRETYLNKETFNSRFNPVQMIAFGIVGVVAMSVLSAVIAIIIRVPQH